MSEKRHEDGRKDYIPNKSPAERNGQEKYKENSL
jgi:hypothetical protein